MISVLDISQIQIELFLLSLFRSAGLIATAPVLSHNALPLQVKFAFSVVLAILVFPFVKPAGYASPSSLTGLLAVGGSEFLLGALIGFMFHLVFMGVQFAGGIIGFQVGFAIVNVIDPTTSESVSLIGEFQFLLATLLFLMMNGHHAVLSGFVDSFRLVPMTTVQLQFQSADEMIRLSSGVFVIAVKIAAPVMLALLLTDCALGILSRTVPQMNIFIVGIPLKIVLGLLVMGMTLPHFSYVFQNAIAKLQDSLSSLIVAIAR
jgi:flagellar biosynthetic protein FliR